MKKLLTLFIIAMAFIQCASAQDSGGTGGFDKSKLFIGGTLGAAFGYATIINVAPMVGYQFTPMFAAGVGLNYSYYNYNDGYSTSKQTYAGMSIFGRVFPIQQFFIQAQPELNYMWASQTINGGGQNAPAIKINQFVPSLLLGGGAAIPTGAHGSIMISIMYDVLQNPYSPYYHQAVYGFGYNVGF
jgi:hypothetical protein